MNCPALKIQNSQPVLECGFVSDKRDGIFVVDLSGGEMEAEPAFSCLVKPEIGDWVLACRAGFNRGFIIALLNRPDESCRPIELAFPSHVALNVENGGLRVKARDEVSLASSEKVSITSEKLQVDADTGKITMGKLHFVGNFLNAKLQKIKSVSDSMESVCRQFTQRLLKSFRSIEGHEEVQCGSSRLLVEQTFSLKSNNSIHTAKEHIKLDAKQIHLG